MGTGEPPACVAEGPGAGRAEAALAALTAELKWQRDEKADAQTGHDAHVHFTHGVTEARGQHRGDQHPLKLSLSDPFHSGLQWSQAGRPFLFLSSQVTGVTVLAPDRKLGGGGGGGGKPSPQQRPAPAENLGRAAWPAPSLRGSSTALASASNLSTLGRVGPEARGDGASPGSRTGLQQGDLPVVAALLGRPKSAGSQAPPQALGTRISGDGARRSAFSNRFPRGLRKEGPQQRSSTSPGSKTRQFCNSRFSVPKRPRLHDSEPHRPGTRVAECFPRLHS